MSDDGIRLPKMLITDVNKNLVPKQKAIFENLLGDEVMKFYQGIELNSEGKVEDIIEQFNKYIIVTINITYERYVFNTTTRGSEQTCSEFATELRRLSKNCNYCEKCIDGVI